MGTEKIGYILAIILFILHKKVLIGPLNSFKVIWKRDFLSDFSQRQLQCLQIFINFTGIFQKFHDLHRKKLQIFSFKPQFQIDLHKFSAFYEIIRMNLFRGKPSSASESSWSEWMFVSFSQGLIFDDLPQTAFSKNDFPCNRRPEPWRGENQWCTFSTVVRGVCDRFVQQIHWMPVIWNCWLCATRNIGTGKHQRVAGIRANVSVFHIHCSTAVTTATTATATASSTKYRFVCTTCAFSGTTMFVAFLLKFMPSHVCVWRLPVIRVFALSDNTINTQNGVVCLLVQWYHMMWERKTVELSNMEGKVRFVQRFFGCSSEIVSVENVQHWIWELRFFLRALNRCMRSWCDGSIWFSSRVQLALNRPVNKLLNTRKNRRTLVVQP